MSAMGTIIPESTYLEIIRYVLYVVATLTIMVILFVVPLFGAEPDPHKSELGSKENPYYTKSDDQISLRQYFDIRHKDLEDKIFQKFESLKEAVDIAKKSTDVHLASMNEFRGALKDQAGTFVTRSELLGAVGFLAALMFGLLQFMKKRQKTNGE